MFSLLAICPFLSFSEERADLKVVVTATRDEKSITEVPADITVIKGEQLEHRSVVQALENFAGVSVSTFNGNSSQAVVSMRGFGENSHGRVLVLVDGIRQNNPDMSGTDWISIPSSAIDRIEIMQGGSSVLYGSNAVAGVISIFTKKASPEKKGTAHAEASVTSFGGHSEKWYVSGGGEKLAVSLSGNVENSEGWRDRSAYDLKQLSSGLSYNGEKLDGAAYLSFFSSEYEMPGASLKDMYDKDPKKAANYFDEAALSGFSASVSMDYSASEQFKLKFTGGWRHKENESDMESWFSWTDTEIDSLYLSPSAVITFSKDSFKDTLTLGADFYSDTLVSVGYGDRGRNTELRDNEVSKLSGGFFALNELRLLDDSLTLMLGARVDRETLKGNFGAASLAEDDETTFTPVSVTAGINYLFPDTSNAYFRYDRVYRTPFTDEQVNYQGYGEGFNSELDPEYGHSFEAGLNYNGIRTLSLGLSGYLLFMKDEIAYSNINFKNENLNDTLHYGLNAKGVFSPAGYFSVTANYSWNVAEFMAGEYDGNRVPLVPEHKFVLMPQVDFPWGLSLAADLVYTGKYYIGQDYANDLDSCDSHFLTGLTVRYRFSGPCNASLYARVNNLFDVEYASSAYVGYDSMYNPVESYYAGAGREIVLGGSLSY